MIPEYKSGQDQSQDFREHCLCGRMYAQQVQDKLTKEYRDVTLTLRQLRIMMITEIAVKIVAYSWAIIWSLTSILCFFTDKYRFIAFLAVFPAAGFWIILSRAAGSIGTIGLEIRKVKQKKIC